MKGLLFLFFLSSLGMWAVKYESRVAVDGISYAMVCTYMNPGCNTETKEAYKVFDIKEEAIVFANKHNIKFLGMYRMEAYPLQQKVVGHEDYEETQVVVKQRPVMQWVEC